MRRETLLAQSLVRLADTLVDDFDVVDLLALLTDCSVEVLGVSAAGLMLAAPRGDLRLLASSSEEMRLVELFELQSDDGPCLECYRSGERVLNQILSTSRGRWPRFAPVALDAGFRSVSAVPMRLRGLIIGALDLFHADSGAMDDTDVVAAQSLADVATIAILQNRAAFEAHRVVEQLNAAFTDRMTIEQAKGVLAERAGVTMEQAFSRMRKHARDRNVRLIEVSRAIIDGSLAFPEPLRRPRRHR